MKENKTTDKQFKIMNKFYSLEPQKVIFTKRKRVLLWKKAINKSIKLSFEELEKIGIKCPALKNQIEKSYENNKNIQSAVFSECVYSQTLANMFNLNIFSIYSENNSSLSNEIKEFIKQNNFLPRYVYSNANNSEILIQAGGHQNTDAALIHVANHIDIYNIEFKEQKAKTGEFDLPKYKEDGNLVIDNEWLNKYPKFIDMINCQVSLNFFEKMGSNIHEFTYESVVKAVKAPQINADVICTKDKNGYLVMFPSNQLQIWAKVKGEIRPAGRNHYDVWTPLALKKMINKIISNSKNQNDTIISIEKNKLQPRIGRGSNGQIKGYKINPLFYIELKNVKEENGILSFPFNKIRQLRPTITAIVDISDIDYSTIKEYYFGKKNNKA